MANVAVVFVNRRLVIAKLSRALPSTVASSLVQFNLSKPRYRQQRQLHEEWLSVSSSTLTTNNFHIQHPASNISHLASLTNCGAPLRSLSQVSLQLPACSFSLVCSITATTGWLGSPRLNVR